MGCLLDDFRTFGINADQWTTAAPRARRDVAKRWDKGRDVSW